MSEQLELLALRQSEVPHLSLFLAIFPDNRSAQAIHELAEEIRNHHHLKGSIRPLKHLHMTLQWLGDYTDVPETVVRDLSAVCEDVSTRAMPFDVTWDHVMSWGRDRARNSLVLLGRSNPDLHAFHQVLLQALINARCPVKKGHSFNPHLTVLYGQESIPEESIVPVSWTVHEFALILSDTGATKYHELGIWRLRG